MAGAAGVGGRGPHRSRALSLSLPLLHSAGVSLSPSFTLPASLSLALLHSVWARQGSVDEDPRTT